jgi:hypothetical protein
MFSVTGGSRKWFLFLIVVLEEKMTEENFPEKKGDLHCTAEI